MFLRKNTVRTKAGQLHNFGRRIGALALLVPLLLGTLPTNLAYAQEGAPDGAPDRASYAAVLAAAPETPLDAAAAELAAGTFHVAPWGSDGSGCGAEASPCASLQKAIDQAGSGSTIKVAEGTYTYPGYNTLLACRNFSTSPAVACAVNKSLTILGGFPRGNWSGADPSGHPSIIDGGGRYRGVSFMANDTAAPHLTMDGFTIRNGLASGAASGTDYDLASAAGGMYIDRASFTLQRLNFVNNRTLGGDTSQGIGGPASGGGLAIADTPRGSSSTMTAITFSGNQALGGDGAQVGGYGLGGGLWAYNSQFTADGLTLTDNLAQGGLSRGSGLNGWEVADGLGGAINLRDAATRVTLRNVVMRANRAIGGAAPNGTAGSGLGGGMEIEDTSTIELQHVQVLENTANGGAGNTGGYGSGGGVYIQNSTFYADGLQLIANIGHSGNGVAAHGSATGGGLFAIRRKGAANTGFSLVNSVIAQNYLELGTGGSDPGGGGGGLYLEGIVGEITHSTIAGNRLGPGLVFGMAVLLPTPDFAAGSAVLNLNYSIVSDHTVGNSRSSALHVWRGDTLNLKRVLYANNLSNDNSSGNPGNPGGPGTYTGLNTAIQARSAEYVDPASYNYHIQSGSPAEDEAEDSAFGWDIDGEARPYGGAADLGADETRRLPLNLVVGNGRLFVNWAAALGSLPGVDHFEMRVTCGPGAKAPQEVRCGGEKNVGRATSFTLTGLTNGATYTVKIEAQDANGGSLGETDSQSATPNKNLVFVPMVRR